MEKVHAPISAREEELGRAVVQAAYDVHRTLGPGLLEGIYETCFCHKLSKRGIPVRRQVTLPLHYDGLELEAALRLDVLLDNQVICELKAVETLLPVHQAQVLSQLKLAHLRLGYLINFNVPLIKEGIRRLVV